MELAFLNQRFELFDIVRVFTVVFLECALSADNAIVIAIIIKQLPKEKRQKALWIGSASALFLRAAGIVFASFFIHYFWVQILGAVYLLYLSISFYFKSKKIKNNKRLKSAGFWKVVIQVEITDFLFAIDSIIAALGVITLATPSKEKFPPNLWIVYIGGIIGLFAMRFAAKIFVSLTDRFKRLESTSHILIGWIGLKLIFESLKNYFYPLVTSSSVHMLLNMIDYVFWIGIFLFIILAFLPRSSKRF